MDNVERSTSASGTVEALEVLEPVRGANASADKKFRMLSHVMYGLYALSWFTGGISGIIAVIIDYIKRPEARGTYYESHFTWRIRTFWWSLLAFTVCILLSLTLILLPIGWLFYFVTYVWGLYRVVKGWLYLNDRKAVT